MVTRKPYPSDVSDDEWGFVAPYLILLQEEASQRKHDLCENFNGLFALADAPWRLLPYDLPLGKPFTSRPDAGFECPIGR